MNKFLFMISFLIKNFLLIEACCSLRCVCFRVVFFCKSINIYKRIKVFAPHNTFWPALSAFIFVLNCFCSRTKKNTNKMRESCGWVKLLTLIFGFLNFPAVFPLDLKFWGNGRTAEIRTIELLFEGQNVKSRQLIYALSHLIIFFIKFFYLFLKQLRLMSEQLSIRSNSII